MTVLSVQNLTRNFDGLIAVNNLSFEVKEGEILGIIGPNGAGKTTLTNLVAGILMPTSGQIVFYDANVTHLPAHLRARMGISRTFQIARPLRDFTVLENVMVGVLFSKGKRLKQAKEQARRICELVSLERINAYPNALTVFELKKLELARALACEPKLLFLDEIMAGLNYEEMRLTIELVKMIRNVGVTICVIEHVMSVISELTDRVIVLDRGQIIAEGPYQVVSKDPKVVTAYLGEEV